MVVVVEPSIKRSRKGSVDSTLTWHVTFDYYVHLICIPSFYPSIYLSFHPFILPSIYPSIHLSFYILSFFSSILLSTNPSIHSCTYISINLTFLHLSFHILPSIYPPKEKEEEEEEEEEEADTFNTHIQVRWMSTNLLYSPSTFQFSLHLHLLFPSHYLPSLALPFPFLYLPSIL